MDSRSGVTYAFAPRSNAYLAAGQIWDIVLSNGSHAAGVVVAPTALDLGPTSSQGFIAGPLDWTGSSAPSAEGCRTLRDPAAHTTCSALRHRPASTDRTSSQRRQRFHSFIAELS